MYESSIVRHFTERGIQQGQKKQSIEAILEVLEIRFDTHVAQALEPRLETIEDLQTLKQLLRSAVQVESLEEFEQNLGPVTDRT